MDKGRKDTGVLVVLVDSLSKEVVFVGELQPVVVDEIAVRDARTLQYQWEDFTREYSYR